MDQIPELEDRYLYTQTDEETFLHLFDYNTTTHEELSSYEPRKFKSGYETEEEGGSELFTLVYLKSHLIEIIEGENELNVYCNVSFLLPDNEDYINMPNLKLIERYLKLKIGFANQNNENHPKVSALTHKNHGHDKHNKKVKVHDIGNNLTIEHDLTKKKRSSQQNFLEVSFDIGPIILPKSQFLIENGIKDNMTCKLELMDMDAEYEVFYQSIIFRSIERFDQVFKPEPKQIIPVQTTIAKATTKETRASQNKINSSKSKYNFCLLNIIFSFVILFFRVGI